MIEPVLTEVTIKKNTDCVYFLASPLTCKKGNDCEFRHSETARLNPRVCWFWCAYKGCNLNCAFRHPPLDGLSSAAATLTKSRVPCFFYGQGYCAKGDKCVFMHGLSTASLKCGPIDAQKLTGLLQQAQASHLHSVNSDPKVTHASSQMPASPAPATCGTHESVSGSNKSKPVTGVQEGPSLLQLSEDVNLPRETAGRCFADAPLGPNRVHLEEPSKNNFRDCIQSDDVGEGSSFNVPRYDPRIYQDPRTYQVIHTDNAYYSPSCDILVEPVNLRRKLQGAYHANYGCAYAKPSHDHQAECNTYDQISSFYHVSRAPASAIVHRQHGSWGEKCKYQALSNKDLRHYLTSRRSSTNRGPKQYQQRLHQSCIRNGIQDYYRKDSKPQEDESGSVCLWDRQKQGWDVASGYKRIRERSLDKKMKFEGERFEAKRRINCWIVDDRSLNTNQIQRTCDPRFLHERKREVTEEEEAFVGPKSLAEIKPEKMREFGQNGLPKEVVHSDQQWLPLSSVATHDAEPVSKGVLETVQCGSSSTCSFDGPKPLSKLLEEKYRKLTYDELKELNAPGSKPDTVEFLRLNGRFGQKRTATTLPVYSTVSSRGGVAEVTEDADSPCIKKAKSTEVYACDTDLSLSLSCHRESPEPVQVQEMLMV